MHNGETKADDAATKEDTMKTITKCSRCWGMGTEVIKNTKGYYRETRCLSCTGTGQIMRLVK